MRHCDKPLVNKLNCYKENFKKIGIDPIYFPHTNYINYDRAGQCSPEQACLKRHHQSQVTCESSEASIKSLITDPIG